MEKKFKLKTIIYTPLLGVLLLTVIALYLLYSVYENQKAYLIESFGVRVKYLNEKINKNSDFTQEFAGQLIENLKDDPIVVYAAIQSNNQLFMYPTNFIGMHNIRFMKEGNITNFKQKEILPLKLPVVDKRSNKMLELYVGLKADELEKNFSGQRNVVLIMIFVLLGISLFLIFVLDRIMYLPLKRLINKMGLLAGGQTNIVGEDTSVSELQTMNTYLEKIDYYIMLLKARSSKLEEDKQKKIKEAQRIKESLTNELDNIYSLALLPLELKEESSTDTIFYRLNKILTSQFRYDISFVFLKKGDVYRYHSSEVKGLKILNEKMQAGLAEYQFVPEAVNGNNDQQFNPYVTDKPPFFKLLNTLNISGTFAHLPIPHIGMLIVGYLDKKSKIKKEEIRRLLMITHIIAFSVENLEAINILKRSLKIRTSELESSHQVLVESLQEKDSMIKLISHDLKAPLRNASGLVDSIKRKFGDKINNDIRERLDRIKSNMDKEMKMVENILGTFKSKEQKERMEKIDLNEIVQRVCEELQYEINQNNITVEVQRNLPVFYSNKHIIEHIILNLIDNACKSFDDHRAENQIRISAAETNHEVIIKISDNGRGIPKDKQEEIFMPFTQISTSQKQKGVGLGLTLIRNFMDKLNGQIELQSEVGVGTTFILNFRK